MRRRHWRSPRRAVAHDEFRVALERRSRSGRNDQDRRLRAVRAPPVVRAPPGRAASRYDRRIDFRRRLRRANHVARTRPRRRRAFGRRGCPRAAGRDQELNQRLEDAGGRPPRGVRISQCRRREQLRAENKQSRWTPNATKHGVPLTPQSRGPSHFSRGPCHPERRRAAPESKDRRNPRQPPAALRLRACGAPLSMTWRCPGGTSTPRACGAPLSMTWRCPSGASTARLRRSTRESNSLPNS